MNYNISNITYFLVQEMNAFRDLMNNTKFHKTFLVKSICP